MTVKRLFTILILMIAATGLFASSSEVYIRPSVLGMYETNVFAFPEAEMTSGGAFKRAGLGGYLTVDTFFSSDARTGLSFSMLYNHPLWSGSEAFDNDSTWVLSMDPTLSFAAGAMFRAQLGIVDLGLALRLSFSSIDLFKDSLLMGLQVEPYVLVPLGSELVMLNFGFVYDAHFYDFLLHDEEYYYRSGYFMLSFGGYIGLTCKIG